MSWKDDAQKLSADFTLEKEKQSKFLQKKSKASHPLW